MSFAGLLNQIILSVLVGGTYAVFAIGLSLSAGVLRLVNLAHGDMIVLTSYLILGLTAGLGVGILPAVAIALIIAFAVGILLQTVLLRHVRDDLLPRLMVTFGLSVVIQNALLTGYGADPKKIAIGGFETASLKLSDTIVIGQLPLLMFVVAIALILGLELLLYRTEIGAEIRAVSENLDTAKLVGLPTAWIMALALGIVGVTVAVAAFFMGVWSNFDPTFGPLYLLTAFEVVVLGGLGSLWGMLAGGIIIALAQTIGGQIDASWQALAGHLAFMVMFMICPSGLFSRA